MHTPTPTPYSAGLEKLPEYHSRVAVRRALVAGQPSPYSEPILSEKPSSKARIDALRGLVGRKVNNDSHLVVQSGTIEVIQTFAGNLAIRFLANGSMEIDNQGGIMVMVETGVVRFHPPNTKCTDYLKTYHPGAEEKVADDFIRQLQRG